MVDEGHKMSKDRVTIQINKEMTIQSVKKLIVEQMEKENARNSPTINDLLQMRFESWNLRINEITARRLVGQLTSPPLSFLK